MLKPYLLLLYTLTLVMFSMAKKPFVPGHLLCLLNKERLAENLPPVHANSLLDLAAQKHSEEQAFYRDMTHDGKDGSSPSDRVSRANYHWNHVGECIAAGYRTMKRVVKAWMNSPGHRRIIMSRSYKEVGIGYARSIDGAPYWTLDFGSRSGPIPGWPNPTEGCPSSTPTDPVIEAQNQTAHSPIPTTLETWGRPPWTPPFHLMVPIAFQNT
ncbi:MAG: CAP domain-containing protein [Piptocephalis tieghemiana]|nr:MAG: CAP domain-containing protein [Piptocephalis tieghemiana]